MAVVDHLLLQTHAELRDLFRKEESSESNAIKMNTNTTQTAWGLHRLNEMDAVNWRCLTQGDWG
jgi:hypothetical protein